LVALLEGVLL